MKLAASEWGLPVAQPKTRSELEEVLSKLYKHRQRGDHANLLPQLTTDYAAITTYISGSENRPPSAAYPRMEELDERFDELMGRLRAPQSRRRCDQSARRAAGTHLAGMGSPRVYGRFGAVRRGADGADASSVEVTVVGQQQPPIALFLVHLHPSLRHPLRRLAGLLLIRA